MIRASLLLFTLIFSFCAGSAQAEDEASVYRHVVLFNFKDSTSKEQVAEVIEAFRALPAEIPEIIGFEWGTQCSPEGFAAGMTHCFLLTFKDKAGLEVYLPHPEHKKFVDLILPILEGKPIVADFVSKDIYSAPK